MELGPQRFTETLHTSIALGIKPDEKQSRAVLHWLTPNKFVVSVALADANGNIAFPTTANVPVVMVSGKAVRVKPLTSLMGEHQVEITLGGKKLEVAPEGQSVKGDEIFVETLGGDKMPIKSDENLQVGVEMSNNKFRVEIPKLIGDKDTRKLFSSGTQEAMKLSLENRQPISTEKEAKDLGFQP